jgi:hypothetical protein
MDPSQNAQPAGAKFPPNIRISPINGDDMFLRSYHFFSSVVPSYCTVKVMDVLACAVIEIAVTVIW